MSKIEKLKLESCCIPAQLVIFNVYSHFATTGKYSEIANMPEICEQAIDDYLSRLPKMYDKEKSRKTVYAVSKRLYNNYFVKQSFHDLKVFMLLRAWMEKLHEEELIDFYHPEYLQIFEKLTSLIGSACNEGATLTNGEMLSGDDYTRINVSAVKKVLKFHDMVVSEGFFIKVVLQYNEID